MIPDNLIGHASHFNPVTFRHRHDSLDEIFARPLIVREIHDHKGSECGRSGEEVVWSGVELRGEGVRED